jgi:hypothetical protein
MTLLSNRVAMHSGGSSDRPIPNATHMNGARPRNYQPLRQFLGHTIHDASRDGHTSRPAAILYAIHHDANRGDSNLRGAIARERRVNCWLPGS